MEREILLEEYVHDMTIHGEFETVMDYDGVFVLRNERMDMILIHDGTWIKKIISRMGEDYILM